MDSRTAGETWPECGLCRARHFHAGGDGGLLVWTPEICHIPPGRNRLAQEAFSPEGRRALGRLAALYIFIAVFFSLYFQSQSAWVLQADKMDRNWLGHKWLPSQLQSINSFLILGFIPLFSYGVYPAVNRIFVLTPLRKISIGLFLMAPTFLVTAWIERQISLGLRPNVVWQFAAYVLLTAAEVLVSIPSLEFSYTQAPKKMKSLVMGLYYLSFSLGNLFTSLVNKLNEGKTGPVAFRSQLLSFLCRPDAGDRRGFPVHGPEIPGAILHPGRDAGGGASQGRRL